jgi:hypothetical protein
MLRPPTHEHSGDKASDFLILGSNLSRTANIEHHGGALSRCGHYTIARPLLNAQPWRSL